MMGAIFTKLGRAPAMMSITGRLRGPSRAGLDGHAAHFEDLLHGHRRRQAVPHRVDVRRSTGLLSLVLAPEPHRLEMWPAEAPQAPDVAQLHHPSLRERLHPRLLEPRAAAGANAHCTERALGDAEQ